MNKSIIIIDNCDQTDLDQMVNLLGLTSFIPQEEFKEKIYLDEAIVWTGKITFTCVGLYENKLIIADRGIAMDFLNENPNEHVEKIMSIFKNKNMTSIVEFENQFYGLLIYNKGSGVERLRKFTDTQMLHDKGYTTEEFELTKPGAEFNEVTYGSLLRLHIELNELIFKRFIGNRPTKELLEKIELTRYFNI